MNMQQIIQQEAAMQQAIVQLLPTIGMLAGNNADKAFVLNGTIEYLKLQNVPPQNIAALQPELERCVDRVLAALLPQLTPTE